MNLLEKHFDIAFAAPDGIKKLRGLILTLAMQGKLVPQDPNDQPASELLKEIEAEKKRLVKNGNIKLSKPFPEINSEELPYKLPINWKWVRLADIAQFINGDRGKNYPSKDVYVPEGIPFINAGHLVGGIVNLNEMNYISEERFKVLGSGKVRKSDILYCLRGSLGKTAVVQDIENGAIASSLVIIRLHQTNLVQFVYYYLTSSFGMDLVSKYDNGSAQPNLSAHSIQKYYFPLPPLAEQHRIVAKIDELMVRCDELEKLRGDRTYSLTTVHTAALNRLLMAKESSDFITAWKFITQHFGELYSVKENVAELRKAILQLAVMGKLVPQDPTDEPASELLKAIVLEKQKLVKEGKIKEQKLLPALRPEEMPYSLPKSWGWVRFEAIVNISSGVTKGRKLNGKEMIALPYLRVANVQRGYLDLDVIKDIEIAKDEIERFELKEQDLLITEGGDWDKVGRTAIWNAEIPLCIHQNHVFKARRLLTEQNEKWIEKYLNSSVARTYFEHASKQTTNLASINKTQLRGCPIPMPPLAEQHRIVAKIEQLMGLCDRLEQHIANAATKQTDLLNVIMTKF